MTNILKTADIGQGWTAIALTNGDMRLLPPSSLTDGASPDDTFEIPKASMELYLQLWEECKRELQNNTDE